MFCGGAVNTVVPFGGSPLHDHTANYANIGNATAVVFQAGIVAKKLKFY